MVYLKGFVQYLITGVPVVMFNIPDSCCTSSDVYTPFYKDSLCQYPLSRPASASCSSSVAARATQTTSKPELNASSSATTSCCPTTS